MKVFTPDGYVKEFITFVEVTDEQLERIKNDVKWFLDKEFICQVFSCKGQNMVVTCIRCKRGAKFMYDKINEFLKKYESVSWHDRNNKFHIRRR